jgi:hypothetical protein
MDENKSAKFCVYFDHKMGSGRTFGEKQREGTSKGLGIIALYASVNVKITIIYILLLL